MPNRLSAWFYLHSVSTKKDREEFWAPANHYEEKNLSITLLVTPLYRLFGRQIEAILDIIDQEIVKSFRQTGLKISHEHVLKEKWTILALINELGNPITIPDNLSEQETVDLFSKTISETMKDEKAFYFEELGKKRQTQNSYNDHLESVRNAVLEAIYDKKLPYT